MTKDILVDIVIPLYNEEAILAQSVGKLVDFLRESDFPYRHTITLANNASTDHSWQVCLELENTHPTVKALDVGSKGKGKAVRTAWSKSSADVLVFMDADMSSDLSFLRALVDAVVIHGHDISIGSRLGKRSTVVSDKLTRKMASRFYNFVVRTALKSPFDDHQCGFKAMKKEAFAQVEPRLKETGFFFDTELIAWALARDLKVCSIDIVWKDSVSSKVSLFKDSLKMFGDVLRLRTRLKKSATLR